MRPVIARQLSCSPAGTSRGGRAGFGHAPALDHPHAKARLELLDHAARYRSPTADDGAHRAQRVRRGARRMVENADPHGGYSGRNRGLLRSDERTEGLGLKETPREQEI